MLDGAPPWTSKKPRGLVNYESIYNQPDKPGALDAWSKYVRTTVSHFKGRINHWEIWNEPWAANFFSGTPEEFGEIIKRGYQAAKEADPHCFIISANSVAHSNASDKWTPAVLKAIGTDFFDALSVHDYNPALYGGKISPPESTVAKFSAMMRECGQDVVGLKTFYCDYRNVQGFKQLLNQFNLTFELWRSFGSPSFVFGIRCHAECFAR